MTNISPIQGDDCDSQTTRLRGEFWLLVVVKERKQWRRLNWLVARLGMCAVERERERIRKNIFFLNHLHIDDEHCLITILRYCSLLIKKLLLC